MPSAPHMRVGSANSDAGRPFPAAHTTTPRINQATPSPIGADPWIGAPYVWVRPCTVRLTSSPRHIPTSARSPRLTSRYTSKLTP